MTAYPPSSRRLMTFWGGGWVLVLAGVITLALAVWALLPAVMRLNDRPLGDGQDIETYGFDLTNLAVPRSLVVPAMRNRDMVHPMDDPPVLIGVEVAPLRPELGKYLVPLDRVVGIELDGEARAYPLSVLNVHEVIHDTLGGRPIAVTYHWPCDSVMVFERSLDGKELWFGVSGLVYNGNMLLYDRASPEAGAVTGPSRNDGSASLWSQLLGRAISGPAVGRSLVTVPAVLVSWEQWLSDHPDTTVVGRLASMAKKRYNKGDPDEYFHLGRILFPIEPLPPPGGPAAFERVVAVTVGEERRVYPNSSIESLCQKSGPCSVVQGGTEVIFDFAPGAGTVDVTAGDPSLPVRADYALWFAWHAMFPADPMGDMPTRAASP